MCVLELVLVHKNHISEHFTLISIGFHLTFGKSK